MGKLRKELDNLKMLKDASPELIAETKERIAAVEKELVNAPESKKAALGATLQQYHYVLQQLQLNAGNAESRIQEIETILK